MYETSASLLERLRHPNEQAAWERFVRLYTPLLYHWTCRLWMPEQDAADLVQDVFALLLQKLPQFRYEPQKSFRAWLHTVVLNKWRDHQRRRALAPAAATDGVLADLEAPELANTFEETEYRQYLVRRALELMQSEFQPTTWKVCWEHAVNGKPAAEVALQLGISADSVYAATSRVLRRLRQDLDGLW